MVYENKLPQGWTTETTDLSADRALAAKLYAASAAAAAALFALGLAVRDVSPLFDTTGVFTLILRFALTAAVTAAALLAQEYLKCIAVGRLTGKPARVVRCRFGAYIEYKCRLDRRGYIIMSLAPAAAISLLALLLSLIMPDRLFWQVYIIFIITLAGSTGDVYIAYRLLKMPDGVRVKNEGFKTIIAMEKK